MASKYDLDRAKETITVSGFNPKLVTKNLLLELFTQGAPVKHIAIFDSRAYVRFHDEESVAYCLALFNGVELHGEKLKLAPRTHRKGVYCYQDHLNSVRKTLMKEYMKIPPPNLPPRIPPNRESRRPSSNKGVSRRSATEDSSRARSNEKQSRHTRNRSRGSTKQFERRERRSSRRPSRHERNFSRTNRPERSRKRITQPMGRVKSRSKSNRS